jgi:hypothetical protein
MGSANDSSVLTVTATSRPKRVAILIDSGATSLDDLDVFTQQAAMVWGGGYWPIIPTDGKEISPDWWSVLAAMDVDVILANRRLEDALCRRIHRQLAPASLQAMQSLQSRLWSVSDVRAVDAYQIIRYHAQLPAYPARPQFLFLARTGRRTDDYTFIARNFGLVPDTIWPAAAFQEVANERIKADSVSKSEILSRFVGTTGRVITPRDLSRLYAPRPYDVEVDAFQHSFQLIVGDSIDDALFAWNRPLTSGGVTGRDFLWISKASTQEPDFLREVGQWIERVYWDQQQRRVTIVSYSENVELLRSVGEAIKGGAYIQCEPRRLERGQFPFGARPAYGHLSYLSLPEKGPIRTEQIALADNSGLMAVPSPPFVLAMFGEDGWMVDLDIECRIDPPRYTNQPDWWKLPRRARVANLFSRGRLQSRIVADGRPSVSVRYGERSIPVHVPSKGALLRMLMGPSPTCQDDVSPPQRARFEESYTSEQGRRFQAMVDLFGGITRVTSVFEDKFWRTAFLEAAGKPMDDLASQTDLVMRHLDAARKAGSLAPATISEATSRQLEDLAKTIARSLHRVTGRQRSFTRKDLRDLFGRIHRREKPSSGTPALRFDDSAEYELEAMLTDRIILQGVTLECPACGIPQWRIVDDLRSTMRCDGCTADFPLPPEPKWTFRISALVESALVRDGVLPLIHAVGMLAEGTREALLVIAPQELREVYDGPIVTDLDLVVLRDGQFMVGEVKSDPAAFDEEVLTTLANVASAIEPDVVVLAAPGMSWPDDIGRRIEELREQLKAKDIAVLPLLMDW